MPIAFEKFLEARRFSTNPFATTNAEQERELLSSYFVRASWFERLVGNPKDPESLILFAPRGYGKTSHRIEVGRLAAERRDGPALIVTFTDFDRLSAGGASQLDITSYVPILCRLTLIALDDLLQQRPDRLSQLRQQLDMFARFCALIQIYAPLQARRWREIPPTTASLVEIYRSAELSAREWLIELADLAAAAGYASVYVLIDGIDELTVTQRSLDAALDIIRPLLDSPGLLQGCGFGFKFFLPDFMEQPMHEQHVGRLDRIPSYHLTWTDDDLVKMLSKRLSSLSLVSETSQGYVTSFRELCDSAVPDDIFLVQAAGSSPRRLIDLTRQIVEEHCRRTNDIHAPISLDTLRVILGDVYITAISSATLARSRTLPHSAPTSTSQPDHTFDTAQAQPPQLFLDARGDIWLGAERLQMRPLPRLLLKCMRYLWNNQHRMITYNDLMQELYADDLADRGDPRSSCDKIVRRLREVIEPGKPTSHTYIDVQPGTGYVLRNIRSDTQRDGDVQEMSR